MTAPATDTPSVVPTAVELPPRKARPADESRGAQAGRQLLRLVESTDVLIAIAEPTTHELTFLNASARRATGLDLGKSDTPVLLEELFAPHARAHLKYQALPRADAESRWSGETAMVDGHGGALEVRVEVMAPRARDGSIESLTVIAHNVTETKRTERAIAESESRFRTIASHSPNAIAMMDPDGRVRFWNPAAEKMFGYEKAEALGADLFDLIAPADSHQTFVPAFRQLRSAGDAGALGRVVEGQARRKDGSLFQVEILVSSVEVRGKWHSGVMLHDVTHERETSLSLQRERILLRTLIDAIPDCIYAKDLETRKTLANPSDLINFDLTREEDAIGKTDFDILDRETAERCYADDLRVISSGEPVIDREECIVTPRGRRRWLRTTKLPLRDAGGRVVGLIGIGHDITRRRRTEEQLRKLSMAVEQSPASVVITDTSARIEYVNPKFCRVTGYQPSEVLGETPRMLKSGETRPEVYHDLWRTLLRGDEWRGEFHNRKKNGELYWESVVIAPIKDANGTATHYLAVKEDITERKHAEDERDMMEIHLRQAQKLESIGQLAAGIAHEINTPMQYVGDNIRFLKDAFGELSQVISEFRAIAGRFCAGPEAQQAVAALEAEVQAADLDYLLEETPRALGESLDGVARVTKIVRAMKEFSHPGSDQKTAVDLNRAIESTVTVARNEWKYVADLQTDLDPVLPPVPCLPGDFNQVLLNLIINAAHAIADVVKDKPAEKGRITVSTRPDGDWVEVRVSDTGTGIPEAIRGRIFDPFFTTKSVGKGTGQGLPIARSVIVDKHGGTLTFDTALGHGTTFIIRLPLTTEADSASPGQPMTVDASTAAPSPSGTAPFVAAMRGEGLHD
jgi:two-component system, NtrC family, sensor kinase